LTPSHKKAIMEHVSVHHIDISQMLEIYVATCLRR
jgi:hypothetical protein